MEYFIIYCGCVIGHVYYAPMVGDKYKGLTVYEVDYYNCYAKVR